MEPNIPKTVKPWRRILAAIVFALFACSSITSCRKTNSPAGVSAADVDGDGIPDSLETSGIEIQHPDGTKEILKSSPQQKDIFVFVAWMQDSVHSHKPDTEAMNTIINSFANSPVHSPSGQDGIRLHLIFAHQPVPEKGMVGSIDPQGNYSWTEFSAIKAAVFPHRTSPDGPSLDTLIHFCLFAHEYSTNHSSGITRTIPGRDFLVSLGGFTNHVGTAAEQAGTFMHELGHALGLLHGGNDDMNFKPNFISVMNYFFQLGGVQRNGESMYTYSGFNLIADEHHLSDEHALTSDSSLTMYGTQYFCPNNTNTSVAVFSISGPVDWRCDHRSGSDVSSDVNGDHAITPLTGRDEWSSLVFRLPNQTTSGISVAGQTNQELTAKTADQIKTFPVGGVSAARKDDGIVVAWKAKPLGQALSYTVFRKSGTDLAPVVIGRTDKTSFVDATSAKGTKSYFVSAVFAPHSFVAQQNTSQLAQHGRVSSSVRSVIAQSNSELVQRFESMGATDSGPALNATFPKVLLQTDLSQPATVP